MIKFLLNLFYIVAVQIILLLIVTIVICSSHKPSIALIVAFAATLVAIFASLTFGPEVCFKRHDRKYVE